MSVQPKPMRLIQTLTGLLLVVLLSVSFCSSEAQAKWFSKKKQSGSPTQAASTQPASSQENAPPEKDELKRTCDPILEEIVRLNQKDNPVHLALRPKIGLLKNQHRRCVDQIRARERRYLEAIDLIDPTALASPQSLASETATILAEKSIEIPPLITYIAKTKAKNRGVKHTDNETLRYLAPISKPNGKLAL
ncbi:MAG: hypothetical protein K2X01_09470 [Cyanobacteria bacterium]|nr:hypothetical protein [Cyanobacteriota bacterium]